MTLSLPINERITVVAIDWPYIWKSAAQSQLKDTCRGFCRYLPNMADSQTSQPPQPTPQNGSQEHLPPSESEDNIKTEPDLDASIEKDVDMNTETQTGDNMNAAPGQDPMAPAPEPSKKETSLREFLGKMDDYAPIVSHL